MSGNPLVELRDQPDQGRCLFSGGKWAVPVKQRPKGWQSVGQPIDCEEKPRDVPTMPRESRTVEARTIKPFPLKAKSRANMGRPIGTGKASTLTPEIIIARFEAHVTIEAIGREFGVSGGAVCHRLKRALRFNAFAARFDALLKCGCGAKKKPSAEKCFMCQTAAEFRGCPQ